MSPINILENQRKFREAIGQFITAFAEVEVYLTIYDSMIDSKRTNNVFLVESFSNPLKIKLKHINRFIKEYLGDNFYLRWQIIEAEIEDLNLFRHHIIHGTGFSSYWSETIKTMLKEDSKNQILNHREFSIKDIKALSERVYHVLTGNDGIQGIFFEDFMRDFKTYLQSQ
ncbi:hypothetical protein KXQ82_19040 [Mucilaginibacter sp. HMF5004]|uniref:hypothetical protein n=1 Tax=Mucilaginibacter rivuli TaxID=2857527 RepID=UPI001C5F3F10|nr:hypothetical protein [Mucilaginibacter rivuli]MBW4891830.1 hypothetical protein [Mucilaginibacter rivuli]